MNFDHIATTLMMTIFKVLGLAPYAMEKTPEWKLPKNIRRDYVHIKFSLSRLGSLYNLLLIAVQLRLLTWAIPTIYSDDYPGRSATTETIDLLATVLGNSVVIVIYLMVAVRQKAAVSLLNRLLTLRDGILGHNGKDTYESCRNYFFLLFVTNIVVYTGLPTIEHLSFKSSTVAIFRTDWPDTIMTWFITQYIFVIKFMYYRLRYVNRRLVDCSTATLSVDTRRLRVIRDAPLNDSLLSNVASLRRVHDDLYQIASEVSDFYSLPILLTITHLVIVAVYSAYYVIIPFVLRNHSHSTLMIIHSVAVIICTLLPIVVLALEVTRFTAEDSDSGFEHSYPESEVSDSGFKDSDFESEDSDSVSEDSDYESENSNSESENSNSESENSKPESEDSDLQFVDSDAESQDSDAESEDSDPMKGTADVVDKLLVFSDINEYDRIELRQFALVLMHRKVRFTANGLFSLDLTLVHSILNMATTYIIILIQHQLANAPKTTQEQIKNSTTVKSYPTGYNGT